MVTSARRGHRTDSRNKARCLFRENVAAVDITLTPAELARIDEVSPKNIAAGDRYADMSAVNR
jgi:diketogulonate reductase-like aldo/keto reductase